ncbi:MAG: HNH endonuclease signature motif containing protein [Bacteroidetes bacterium]|nr:HNH endonuclease signature motif containing protein [Bacteroidota bacterium]
MKIKTAATKHSWTGSELRYLISRYPHISSIVIAEFLQVSLPAVYNQANLLGLKKSEAFLLSEKSGRLNKKLADVGRRYRFKKGHVPANKGKKMSPEVRERIKHTWFKKGHEPINTKHDGYISIRKDSHGRPYAHIRISKGRFDLLHRYIWKQHNGPVPDDKIVTFKNGDTSDFRIENLELITREENMLRNTRHNYPIELQEAIIALNKLKKSIKNYGEE